MNDLSAGASRHDAKERLLVEALASVRQKAEDAELDFGFYEEQVRLLESLSTPAGADRWFVDRRIELAWEIVRQLGTSFPSGRTLSRRALIAAFPSGSELTDRRWERKWHTALGSIEFWSGRVDLAWRLKSRALQLARELGDTVGEVIELGNFAGWLNGAGRYESSLELVATAVHVAGDVLVTETLRGFSITRGNALFRLGLAF
ncbi:MAG TPA: hypothetical protein PKV98_12150, partial [Burkholderiaceae bacterium]|nr:hypothetical protein [Burkholderiaceae bacterium]